jgi:putative tryptophan/tyrosine transport system substrate-binding protein
MRSRSFLALILALAVFAAPLAAAAQGTRRVPRVGIVSSTSPSVGRQFLDAFRSGLREMGYVEGQSIFIEERWAEGKPERFGDLIADLLRSNADVIVVSSAAGARAAKNVATTTPVVFVGVADPVGSGIVSSLARPGGNITGTSVAFGEGFAGKWVELVKDTLPRVSSVAALAQTNHPMKGTWVTEMGAAAQALGLKLQVFDARDPADLENALSMIAKARPGALIVTASPLFVLHRKRIADFALQHRLPTMGFVKELVGEGVLMSYGPSFTASFRRAAVYVDRILKGAKPADLPVEQPTKFEFVLNRRTANALNLTIPPTILIRADEVIE